MMSIILSIYLVQINQDLIMSKIDDMNFRYGGIIPYAIVDDEKGHHIYILLGKEINILDWPASGKWSDFGGGPEIIDKTCDDVLLSVDDMINVASRESYEELMGFIGSKEEIQENIKNRGIPIILNESRVFICLLEIKYNIDMPTYFNNTYKYITRCAKEHPRLKYKFIESCPKGYLEKSEIKWFELSEIKKTIELFKMDDQSHYIYRTSFMKSMIKILDMNLLTFSTI